MIEAIHSKLKNQVNIGNFEMRAPQIDKGRYKKIGVGGVADSQTRFKPLKTPPNHPENRLTQMWVGG